MAAWDNWPVKLANGEVANADDVLAALNEIKTHVQTLESTAITSSDSRLTDARTPTAHAATHKSGGTDETTRSGTWSATTDGSGAFSVSVAHGASWTPDRVIALFTQDPGGYGKVFANLSGSNIVITGANNAGNTAVAGIWIAIR